MIWAARFLDLNPNLHMFPAASATNAISLDAHTLTGAASLCPMTMLHISASHMAGHLPTKWPASLPYIGHSNNADELSGCSNAPSVTTLSSTIDALLLHRRCSGDLAMLRRFSHALLQQRQCFGGLTMLRRLSHAPLQHRRCFGGSMMLHRSASDAPSRHCRCSGSPMIASWRHRGCSRGPVMLHRSTNTLHCSNDKVSAAPVMLIMALVIL